MKKRKTPPHHDHRTSQPSDSRIAEMRSKGYAVASELAERHGITVSTLYTWNRKGQLPVPPGVTAPLAMKWAGNRWFLIASIDLKMAPQVGP
jgi:transposase-like protein